MDYHIKTQDLNKTYKKWYQSKGFEALKSLTFEVPANTIMGFLGRNGAGKTTTIKILLGLVHPTAGSAFMLGENIIDTKSRRDVCYMPELPALDMRDNSINFLHIIGKMAKMNEKEIKKRTQELIDEVGLRGKENDPFATFSKGMKQRIEFAQAIFSKPKLLILDEPFSGLDPIGRKDIRNLIVHYNKTLGTTVFFSSHILNDVDLMCDTIGILDKGELKTLGQKEDLLGVETVEISGFGIKTPGDMFLEKMSDQMTKTKDKISIFITPDKNYSKVVDIFHKYDAKDIKVEKHCKSLEDFFVQIVGDN